MNVRSHLRLDGLGAYYPRTVYYRDGSTVDFAVKGLGDIPACRTSCGLGRLGQAGQISGESLALSATQIAGAGISAIAASGGSLAVTLGLSAAAIPVIGVAVAGVTLAISLLWNSFNHDPRKNATTSIVNQIEPRLQENLAGYMAGPRTVSSQAQALANFDAAWNLVLQNCNQPQFGQSAGEPGYNCIHDRMEGACHWTKSGKSPGVPPDCWNWFIGYRDVIASDPNVKPDPSLIPETAAGGASDTSGAGGVAQVLAGSTVGVPNYLLLAGLLVGAAFLGDR